MKKVLFCIVFLLVIVSQSFGADYYFSTTGDDGGAGTIGDPWETTNKANDIMAGAASGSTFYFKRGDRWTTGEAIGLNVNLGAKTFTIDAYGAAAEKPTFDGDTMRCAQFEDGEGAGSDASIVFQNIRVEGMNYGHYLFQFAGLNNFTFKYCEFDGHSNSSGTNEHSAVGIFRMEGHTEVAYNTLLNAYDKADGIGSTTDYMLIYMTYAVDGGSDTWTYSIHDNIMIGANGDCIQMKGVNRVVGTPHTIYNNEIGYNGENGIDFKCCGGVNIYNNFFTKNNGLGDPKGGTGGAGSDITMHTGVNNYGDPCNNIYIYKNTFYDSNRIAVQFANSSDCSFENNYVLNVARMVTIADMNDIKISGNAYVNLAMDDNTGDAFVVRLNDNNDVDNCQINQNSFYLANRNFTKVISFETLAGHTGNELRGNVIYTLDAAIPIYILNAYGDNATIDHNAVYTAGATFIRDNTTLYDSGDQATWIAAGHTGAIFLTANPFTDQANWNLKPTNANLIDAWAGPGAAYDSAINHDQSEPLPEEGPNITTGDQDDYYAVGEGANPFEYGGVLAGTTGGGGDTTPPVVSTFSPTTTLPGGTTETTVSVVTNEQATCQHNLTGGLAYDDPGQTTFTTTNGSTPPYTHSYTQTGLSSNTQTPVYIRCEDAASNANTVDFVGTINVGAEDNLLSASTYLDDSKNWAPTHPITRAWDNDLVNSTGSVGGDNIDTGWVSFDFGIDYDFGDARIYGDDDANWYCYTWEMEYSDDNSNWSTAFTGQNCFGQQWYTQDVSAYHGRYVKFTITGNTTYHAIQFAELWLDGAPSTGGTGAVPDVNKAKRLYSPDNLKVKYFDDGWIRN